MKSSPHPLTRQSTEVVLKDSDRRSERGGVNGSPIKILLDENKAYVPIQLKKSLSYNRQSDASQLVTCSPYERLGKSRRKAKAKINQNTENLRTSGSKLKAIYSSNSITKPSLNQACDDLTMISKA